jgi:hypothetical protein
LPLSPLIDVTPGEGQWRVVLDRPGGRGTVPVVAGSLGIAPVDALALTRSDHLPTTLIDGVSAEHAHELADRLRVLGAGVLVVRPADST